MGQRTRVRNDVQEIAAIREVPNRDAFASLPTTGRMDTALDHAIDDRPQAWLRRVLVSVSAVDRDRVRSAA